MARGCHTGRVETSKEAEKPYNLRKEISVNRTFKNSALILALSLISTPWALAQEKPSPKLPDPIPVEGFKQLLPRGGIPAVVNPTFLEVAKADIPDGAWILGIASGEEAFAYDLNLLNHHEIVNHDLGGAAIAAVW